MAKHIHVLRIIGDRTAKIQRYSDRVFFMMVALDEKLAEGRQVRLNVFGTYSEFYHAVVEADGFKRKVDEELHDLTDQPAQMTDAFTLEVFPDRRSRLVAVCGKKAMRMAFTIEGRKNGKFGSACEFIDLPEGALLPDGEPVYRKMLDAFCKLWDREREDKNTEFISFRISLMDYDVVDPYKDVFTIKVKEN